MSTSNAVPSINIRREYRFRPVDAGTFHILMRITAPIVVNTDRQRPPLDLAFVVDRSGSMGAGKLDLARRGVEHALRLLDERDTISLVAYDDRIDTLLEQRHFGPDTHSKAVRRLGRIHPRGSTDLAGGWLTGCDQLAAIADERRQPGDGGAHSMVRVLLLTDGLANVGMTDPAEIAHHAKELADRGISTSTLGVGDDYDEDLLAAMADAGRGHFHHIEDAGALPRVFAGELGEMLQLAMRDATLSVRLPDGWRAHLLNDLPIESQDGWITLRLDELHSQETRSLLWEIELPSSNPGRTELLDIRLRWLDAEGQHRHEQVFSHTVETRIDPGRADMNVQNELARLIGARARAEAIRYNKAGRFDLAQASIRHYIDSLPETEAGQDVAQVLEAEVMPIMMRRASPAELKRQLAQSRNVQRTRRDYSRE